VLRVLPVIPPTFADWCLLVLPYLSIAGTLVWHRRHR
jgi:hypothetical protein